MRYIFDDFWWILIIIIMTDNKNKNKNTAQEILKKI
jgi:hypothetical protein